MDILAVRFVHDWWWIFTDEEYPSAIRYDAV